MKFNLFLLLPIFFIAISINAQDQMLAKNGKQYSATPVWNFLCENYAYDQDLEIQLAKTETGGLLKLTVEVSDSNKQIGGRVYLNLQNGDFIYCADKGMREFNNGKSSAYFILSAKELAKLKAHSIQSIRFRITGEENSFSSEVGYYTATNKKQLITPFDKSDNQVHTKSDIKDLLK